MTEDRFWWQDGKLSPQEKEKLLESIEKDASYNEIHYQGCSQAVLGALQKNLGIGGAEAFKASSGLAGGICSMGEACGAVSGAVMAIGLAYGREGFSEGVNAHHDPVWLECRRRGRYFCEKFRREYGYLTCPGIKYQVRGIYPFQPSKAEPTPEEWDAMDSGNHDSTDNQNHYHPLHQQGNAPR